MIDSLDILGVKETIPDNADLDDYTTPGKYTCISSSTAGTLPNTPVSSNMFSLFVISHAIQQLRFTQIVIRCANNTTAIYYRSMATNNIWGSWYSISGSAVSTNSVGDPVVMGDDD